MGLGTCTSNRGRPLVNYPLMGLENSASGHLEVRCCSPLTGGSPAVVCTLCWEQSCWWALLEVCVLIGLDLGAGQNEIQGTRAQLADTDRLEDECGEQMKSLVE